MFSMFYMLIPPFLLHVHIYFSVFTIHVTPKIAVDFIYVLCTRFFSRYVNMFMVFCSLYTENKRRNKHFMYDIK